MHTQKVQHTQIIAIIILLVVILSFVNLYPHWYAARNVPDGFVFSGQASWFDPWDVNVYVSAVRWGQTHGFLMENVYTTQPNQAIVYYPVYTFAGMIWKYADPYLVFHGLSIVSTLILAATIAIIVHYIFHDRAKTFYVSATVLLAGGLGFMVYPAVQSIDMSMTAVSFQSALQRPHEALAVAAHFTALFGSYLAISRKKNFWRRISLTSLVITLFLYPYYIVSFFSILLGFLLWQYGFKQALRHWRFVLMLFSAAIVTVGAMWANLQSNHTFSDVIGQHLSSPSFMPFTSAYGVLLIFFGYQCIAMRPFTRLRSFLVVWVCVSILFALLPLGIARFYLRGMFFPLIILAFISLDHLVKTYFSLQYNRVYAMLAISLSTLLIATSVMIFSERLGAIDDGNPWYYHSKDQVDAIDALRQVGVTGILSGYQTGNSIPALTDARVYVGHLIQTPAADKKLDAIADFYSLSMATPSAQRFLAENKIDVIYWGKEELLFAESPPEARSILSHYPFMTLWYENDSVRMYWIE